MGRGDGKGWKLSVRFSTVVLHALSSTNVVDEPAVWLLEISLDVGVLTAAVEGTGERGAGCAVEASYGAK